MIIKVAKCMHPCISGYLSCSPSTRECADTQPDHLSLVGTVTISFSVKPEKYVCKAIDCLYFVSYTETGITQTIAIGHRN